MDAEHKRELLCYGAPERKVYTVMEAKGLEFDVTVLWRLAEGNDQQWSILLTDQTQFSENLRIPLLYYLNRLYVAITRSVGELHIFENAATIKNRLEPLFERHVTNRHDLDTARQNPTWKQTNTREGDRQWAVILEEHEDFDRAAQYFEEAKDQKSAWRCRAKHHRMLSEYARAGDYFLRAAMYLDAAFAFYSAKQWSAAVDAADKHPAATAAKRLAARAFYNWKSEENLLEATERLVQSIENKNEHDQDWIVKAARSLQRLERFEQAAKYFDNCERFEEAGECYVRCNRWNEALSCFHKVRFDGQLLHVAEGEVALQLGEYLRALESFEKARRWDRVFRIAQDLNLVDEQINALVRMNDHRQVLRLTQSELDKWHGQPTDRIIGILRKQMAAAEALDEWRTARWTAEKLSDCTGKAGPLYQAADFAAKEGQSEDVVDRIRIEAMIKEKKHFDAATLLEKLGQDVEAVKQRAAGFLAKRDYENAGDLFEKLVFIKSLYHSRRSSLEEGQRMAGTMRDDIAADVDEDAAKQVFEFISEATEQQLSLLKDAEHEVDCKKLASLIVDHELTFTPFWTSLDANKKQILYRVIPNLYDMKQLDVDQLEFISAMLDADAGKISASERKQLIQALEDVEGLGLPWDHRFSEKEMCRAWELTGDHLKTSQWYESLWHDGNEEPWVLDGAIEARRRQYERFIRQGNQAGADRIAAKIQRLERMRAAR